MLEEALAKDIQSIKDIKDMATVKLCFPEEQKANQLQVILPSGPSEVVIRPDDVGSISDSLRVFGLSNISELRSESNKLQNHLSKSSNSIEGYVGVINECIIKVANQINKSGQVISKAKSLAGVIKNNLANIANIKSSEESWKSIIKQDKTLTEKVMSTMSDLQILEVSKDCKEIKMYDDRLEHFKQKDFDREECRQRVMKSMSRFIQS